MDKSVDITAYCIATAATNSNLTLETTHEVKSKGK
jgi:hypothetical protein